MQADGCHAALNSAGAGVRRRGGRVPQLELLHRGRGVRADGEARFEVAGLQAHEAVAGVGAVDEAARHEHAAAARRHVVGDDLAHHPWRLGMRVGEGGDGQGVVVQPGEAAGHLHDDGDAGVLDLERGVDRRDRGRGARGGAGRLRDGRTVAVGVDGGALRARALLHGREGGGRGGQRQQREEAVHRWVPCFLWAGFSHPVTWERPLRWGRRRAVGHAVAPPPRPARRKGQGEQPLN